MPGMKSKEAECQGAKAGPERDIRNMLIKMAISLLVNYMTRRFRRGQERKKVLARVEKLQKKGKKVPADLLEEAESTLGKRGMKKAREAAGKAAASKKAAKKKSRRRVRRLFLLLLLAGAAAAAARARKGTA